MGIGQRWLRSTFGAPLLLQNDYIYTYIYIYMYLNLDNHIVLSVLDRTSLIPLHDNFGTIEYVVCWQVYSLILLD